MLSGGMSDQHTFIATTAFGLEAVVKRELIALGYEPRSTSPGWVEFDGDLSAIARTNIWLRTADRVLIKVASFQATDFETLFETTKSVDWKKWLPPNARFPVDGRSHKSQLTSVPANQRAVKKAIVEAMLAQHQISTLPEDGPLYRCQIALLNDEATLTIDTTGPSLHKRGYREFAGGAPIKETLASAMVQLSFWHKEKPFLDPFCGSGTIAIEAAMLGRNMAPGLQREFAAGQWENIPSQTWEEARSEALDLQLPKFEETLVATDRDFRILKTARLNAEKAGVADQIYFQEKEFDDLQSSRKYGCLISNPPYGERLSDWRELKPLYQSMPLVLKRLPTWSHFIITSYDGFQKLLQKNADRRRKLYNGRIECVYYQFHGPKPRTEESQPVFGGINAKAQEQAELFQRRLVKRARHLRKWPAKRGIHCYRLYEKDVPEIPLVVDKYDDHLHLSEFERPHDRDLAQHDDWLELMRVSAAEALDVPVSNTFLKRRGMQRGKAQHGRVSQDRYEIEVEENGLKFLVNLSDYVDTGLFLDHRETRMMVCNESLDKDVLNLFAYTGSFTVYAADGGAKSTTTVDLSSRYLDWAERNMELNGFTSAAHNYVQSDIREYLSSLPQEELFDLAIVDPPTFSNSKSTEQDWVIQEHYAELLNSVLNRLRSGGIIYFSTNYRRFKFDESFIRGDCREISKQTVPEDFRNKRIHRCWRIEKY